MLAGTDDHLTWLSPVILNLENMGLTHLESEIRVTICAASFTTVAIDFKLADIKLESSESYLPQLENICLTVFESIDIFL